jgi:thiamine biosynthesis lipoprotein
LFRVEQIMGMPIAIEIRDAEPDAGLAAIAFGMLRRADEVFSTYQPNSQISRLARGELRISDCDPAVDEVLSRAARLASQTLGFFSARPGGRLDPSGLVKGWAVQRAADAMSAGGARNFVINAGGDVVARGEPEPGEWWRIGIRHPEEHEALAAVVAGSDIAVATSGEYERGAHILDPHTRRPPSGLLSVTVVGPDLGTADAYATSIFAMGRTGPEWALGLGDYETLCITSDRQVLSTPGFARYRAS